MKTFNFLFSILFILYSCSKADDSINSQSSLPSAATRTAGDGVYDALGYGYDITDEFLGEMGLELLAEFPMTKDLGSINKGTLGEKVNASLAELSKKVKAALK